MKETSDEIWDIAWQWAQYPMHDVTDTHPDLQALQQWLAQHPSHKVAYDQACELWLLSGLIPPKKS